MKAIVIFTLLSVVLSTTLTQDHVTQLKSAGFPALSDLVARSISEPELLAKELRDGPFSAVMKKIAIPPNRKAKANAKPIVVAHGMGDSCFNGGMMDITKAAGAHLGVYSVCIPGGDNVIADTLSGFLTNMDKNVDIFAAKVQADANLKDGFDAFGLSQGNSIIRGYIERYNSPPVRNYLSIHGTIMGVSSFPNCDPSFSLCAAFAEILGDLAFNPLMQGILFQANYFRDPLLLNSTGYQTYSQLAQWNNEGLQINATYTRNWASLNNLAMVRALEDTMVFPNIGEWWGEFVPGQYKETWNITQTNLFENDSFGLKQLYQANRITFNSTTGNHLEFTEDQLYWWIDHYFN